MPRTERKLEFANFICRFGDELVLLDLIDEVVLPAFQDQSLARIYTDTSYHLLDVDLITLSKTEGAVGISGRFVKNTILKSEQVLDPSTRQLIQREQSLPNSPSAIFLLLLDTHRLLYVKETADAPGLTTFKSTIQNFLTEKHKEFINKTYETFKKSHEADLSSPHVTKASLRKQYPHPTLEIVPLASQESLAGFIQQFDTLKTVEVQLLDPNHDLDNDQFFVEIRKKKESIGSSKTTLRHANTKGLDKGETIGQLSGVANQGNHLIKLDGEDSSGDRLRGNNEKFQLRVPISSLSHDVKAAAQKMYSSLQTLVQAGTLKAADVTSRIRERVSKYIN